MAAYSNVGIAFSVVCYLIWTDNCVWLYIIASIAYIYIYTSIAYIYIYHLLLIYISLMLFMCSAFVLQSTPPNVLNDHVDILVQVSQDPTSHA